MLQGLNISISQSCADRAGNLWRSCADPPDTHHSEMALNRPLPKVRLLASRIEEDARFVVAVSGGPVISRL